MRELRGGENKLLLDLKAGDEILCAFKRSQRLPDFLRGQPFTACLAGNNQVAPCADLIYSQTLACARLGGVQQMIAVDAGIEQPLRIAFTSCVTAELADDGSVKGLDAEIKRLVDGADTGFLFEKLGKYGMNGAKPGEKGDNGSSGMTLEKLRAMSPAERFEFSTKHPDDYKTLYGG